MRMKAFAAAIAVASTFGMASTHAQEVIPNPGRCAQFYPNANCENYGPGNPYRGPNTYQQRRSYEGGVTTGSARWGTSGQVNRGVRRDRMRD